jgi:hypothetical protein
MKKKIISIHVIIGLVVAQLPSQAESLISRPPAHGALNGASGMIRKGQPLSAAETIHLEAKSTVARVKVSWEAGGAEENTGVVVLAVIGALVLVGAVIYAVNRNSENRE